MGVVYRARHRALDRVVALKMILAGTHASTTDLSRFRTEAQAIARLSHPNIVQVFEVGEHEGRPFLSLEFCGGGSLDRALAGTPQPPAQAADLVEVLARAVEVAHRAGIVHRDLKPANVLLATSCRVAVVGVDEANAKRQAGTHDDFVPKITDFGLAKRLDAQGAVGQTISGAVMGTPSYMAPEQAQGNKDIGPAADVYALGAILYECLTGRPPFRAASPLDTLLQVVSDDPIPPSRLSPGVPRDLETICLMCLDKEPGKRYPSAAELADDLARYRHNEPIHARPVSLIERGVKWLRRHPALASVASVSILAVLALLFISFAFNLRLQRERDYAVEQRDEAERARAEVERQRNQARENFRLARQAVDEYARKAAEDPRLQERGVQEVRREWLQAAEKFYQEFVKRAGDDPDIRIEQARAYSRLASITAEIGTHAEAEKQYQKVLPMWQVLLRDHPDRHECRFEMSHVLAEMGGLEKARGRHARAEELLRESLAIIQTLAREHPQNVQYRGAEAAGHNNLGLFFKEIGQPGRAEESFRTVLELTRTIPSRTREDRDRLVFLGMAHLNLGSLYMDQQRYAPAEEAFRQARQVLEARQKQGELTFDHRKALAMIHLLQGNLYTKTDRPAQAEKSSLRALELLEALAEEQPHVKDVQNILASSYMMVGVVYFNRGETSRAATYYDKASAYQDRLYRLYPNEKQYRTNRLAGLKALAALYFGTRQAERCEATLLKALVAARELTEAHPNDPEMKHKLASVHAHLRRHFLALAQRDRGLAEFGKEFALREELARKYPSRSDFTTELAGNCCNLGQLIRGDRPAEALALYNRGVRLLEGVLAREPLQDQAADFLGKTLNSRALLLAPQRPGDALADRYRIRDLREQQVCLHPGEITPCRELAAALRDLGSLYHRLNRLDEAEACYRQEFALLDDAVRSGVADDDPRQTQDDLAVAAGRLASLLRQRPQGRLDEAARVYRRAIVLYAWQALTRPETVNRLVGLGGEVCDLATLYGQWSNRPETALPWYARAERTLEQALALDPKNATAPRFLRNVFAGRASTLYRLDRPADAVLDQLRVVKYHEQLVATARSTARDRFDLAVTVEFLGQLYRDADQRPKAESAYARAANLCEALLDDRTLGRGARQTLARLCRERGRLHRAKDAWSRAIPFWQREQKLREGLLAEQPDSSEREALARCLEMLAEAHQGAGQKGRAVEAQREAVCRWDELVRAFPESIPAWQRLAQAHRTAGLYEFMNNELSRSCASLARACAWHERLLQAVSGAGAVATRAGAAETYFFLVNAYFRQSLWPQAERASTRALELYQGICRDEAVLHRLGINFGGTACNRGHALQLQGKHASALANYDLAIRLLAWALERDEKSATARTYLGNSLSGRAMTMSWLGRYADSLADLDRAIALGPSAERPGVLKFERAYLLAHLGRHARAVEELKAVLAMKPPAETLYRGACILALAARAAARDDKPPLAVRERQAEQYARESLALLDRARQAGYFRKAENCQRMDRDSDLDGLRHREDFKTWLAKRKAKTR
jgi:tetratricopeptide (TPR) repeat protein